MGVPPDFLKTAESILTFAQTVAKVKAGMDTDAVVSLNRKECRSLIWGFQLLREGKSDGRSAH